MRDDARAREGRARGQDVSVLLLRRAADSKLTAKADIADHPASAERGLLRCGAKSALLCSDS